MSSLVIDVCGCSRVWRDRNWEFPEIPGSRGQLRRHRESTVDSEKTSVCVHSCAGAHSRCREILAVWTQQCGHSWTRVDTPTMVDTVKNEDSATY